MSSQQINVTLGTAGHIDHGKTALIKCLTGCDTDRLKEEKERGMSIDLGYAPCTLADMEVGIVDVPGHEHFIKTMVAGAACMDGVILVVAADDGVMPQTREHLDILTLLGIQHGVVALTKIDRVRPDELAQARRQVREFLKGTFLEDAPVLPLSSMTGEGFADFLDALKQLIASIPPRRIDGVFRMPIDRAFSARGYGSIIAGIPVSGSIHTGDEIVLLPQALKGRIKAIQVYSRPSDVAQAGQCAAINIPQFDHKTIERGQTLTVGDYFQPGQWYGCELTLLPHDKLFVKNAQHVKFHTGTSQVEATVYLLEDEAWQGGRQGLVQIRLDAPVVAGPKDRFILRAISPAMTIGGGMIVEAIAKKLKRSDSAVVQDFRDRAAAVKTDAGFLTYCVRTAPGGIADGPYLAHRTRMTPTLMSAVLETLIRQGHILKFDESRYLHPATIKQVQEQLLACIEQFHQQTPQSPGLPRENLSLSAVACYDELLEKVISDLKQQGKIIEKNRRLALPHHQSALPPEQQALLQKIEAVYQNGGFAPPDLAQAAQVLRLPPAQLPSLLKGLVEHGRLTAVGDNLYFHADVVEQGRRILIEYLKNEKKLESVKFKYLINTTRKYALPLLDYYDRVGLTRRVGYTRYLRHPVE